MTCDYLIGKGVTKDRVIATFAKRGYKLPQNHLDRYKEQQQQWKDHQATLIQQQPLASTSTTYPSHLNQHSNGYEETNMPAGKRASSPVVTDHSMSLPGPSTSKPTLNKSHHRATSSLTDPSLIRLGTLIPTPPTSAPPPTTKRRRESQDTTESLHPTSHTPAPPSTIPSSSAAVKDPSAELKLLKEELVRKEAAAKEALKARRAALAKQNAQRAESFIEGLLSESKASIQSVPSSAGMQSTQTLPAEVVRDSTTLASTSKASSTVADDLEDYEDTDHSQVAASGAPVASSSTSLPLSTTRPEVLRRGSSNTFTTQVTRQQRAVATDFEGDPSHKLSGVPRWTEQLLESSRRDTAHTDMLIDLSDSDSEDDSDYDEADGQQKSEDDKEQLRLAVEKSRLQDSLNHNNYYQVSSLSSTSSSIPYPSYSLNNVTKISESARSSPAPSPATIPLVKKKPSPPSSIRSKASTPSFPSRLVNPTATPAIQSTSISTAGKAELEAKQAEIRKMLEMIKKLEGKKKQKKHTTEGSDSFSTNITAGKDDSALMAVERDRVGERIATERIADTQHQEKIDAAKETVGRLLDEQDQLVTSSELARSEIDDKVGAGSSSGIELSSSNSTTSSSVTPSNLAMRESSSDEAMSISSEGE